MFEVVMKLLNRNQKTSKEIAKDRLKVVLIHDRANISPEVMQALKNDIIEVISHYMDINKNEIRMPISDISDLKNFSEQIIEVVQRYLHPVLLKEVLYTRWGNYEMPEPYKILLEKGPRKNLKKL